MGGPRRGQVTPGSWRTLIPRFLGSFLQGESQQKPKVFSLSGFIPYSFLTSCLARDQQKFLDKRLRKGTKEIRSFPSLLNQIWIAAASPAWPPKREGNEGTQLDMGLPEAPQSNGCLQPGLPMDQRQNTRGAQLIPSSAGLCWSALTQSISCRMPSRISRLSQRNSFRAP